MGRDLDGDRHVGVGFEQIECADDQELVEGHGQAQPLQRRPGIHQIATLPVTSAKLRDHLVEQHVLTEVTIADGPPGQDQRLCSGRLADRLHDTRFPAHGLKHAEHGTSGGVGHRSLCRDGRGLRRMIGQPPVARQGREDRRRQGHVRAVALNPGVATHRRLTEKRGPAPALEATGRGRLKTIVNRPRSGQRQADRPSVMRQEHHRRIDQEAVHRQGLARADSRSDRGGPDLGRIAQRTVERAIEHAGAFEVDLRPVTQPFFDRGAHPAHGEVGQIRPVSDADVIEVVDRQHEADDARPLQAGLVEAGRLRGRPPRAARFPAAYAA